MFRGHKMLWVPSFTAYGYAQNGFRFTYATTFIPQLSIKISLNNNIAWKKQFFTAIFGTTLSAKCQSFAWKLIYKTPHFLWMAINININKTNGRTGKNRF